MIGMIAIGTLGTIVLVLNRYSRYMAYKKGMEDTEKAYKSKLRLIADSEMEAWAKLKDHYEISKKRAEILNKIIERKDRELNILRSEKAYNSRKKRRKMRKKGRVIR